MLPQFYNIVNIFPFIANINICVMVKMSRKKKYQKGQNNHLK